MSVEDEAREILDRNYWAHRWKQQQGRDLEPWAQGLERDIAAALRKRDEQVAEFKRRLSNALEQWRLKDAEIERLKWVLRSLLNGWTKKHPGRRCRQSPMISEEQYREYRRLAALEESE